ncbi:DNA-3-methyladenine glycosylase family protein [Halorussus amylolyticus]|uniref:DNA-3-methyladenine glycosylase family protein n=1 Tax=Halorussus amylolyticus TaxID=1126242 RepID=UPI001052232A|nr:DNA glycosylase [Halorussus amylolyticus]
MESGSIPLTDASGGLDLQSTLESGQTFLWRREDGRAYEETAAHGGSAWYYTVAEGEVVRARQRDGRLEWEATTDAEPLLEERLRLDDDLPEIFEGTDDSLVADAREAYPGMRIVNDPFFPCLVSFICSAQMRVERIHAMGTALAREFGETVGFDGETYHAFPTPERLAEATEAELRELGLGYRAPYVQRSAELAAAGEVSPAAVREMEYEDARDALQAFVGVGDKVADCVLLFSLGFLEAVPLDTWIQTAIEDHYPDCERGSYAETSRAIRRAFGGEYAGYAQTYVFHYLRNRE